jgi:ribosomal protein S18 acetylase RimI-like enzyme
MTSVAPIPSGADPSTDAHVLDNVVWHALRTTQRHVAQGGGAALRYRPDVAPFHAVERVDATGWEALAELAGPGGVVVLFRDRVGAPPAGWTLLADGDGHQMVASDDMAWAPAPDARPLTDDDVDQMVALVRLTQPGPFMARTIELGGYVGVFDGDRLVAMAGERMRCPGYTEISAVCTHPDGRGRGLAASLTAHVGAAIRARGETPFLHVAAGNDVARRVYERLGYAQRRMVHFAALRTPGHGSAP